MDLSEFEPLFARGYVIDAVSIKHAGETFTIHTRTGAPYHVTRCYPLGDGFLAETVTVSAKSLAEAHAAIVHRVAELELERLRVPEPIACVSGGARAAGCAGVPS